MGDSRIKVKVPVSEGVTVHAKVKEDPVATDDVVTALA